MNEFFQKKINDINVVSSSKIYIKNIERTLKMLKELDGYNFIKVNKYLKIILIHPKIKNCNFLSTKNKAWLTGYENFLNNDYDAPYMASLLIHEVYHIVQYLSGHKNYGEKAERAVYLQQKKFLKKIKYDYAVDWLDNQYKNKWWKSMDKDKKSSKKLHHLLDDYQNGKLILKKLKDIKL